MLLYTDMELLGNTYQNDTIITANNRQSLEIKNIYQNPLVNNKSHRMPIILPYKEFLRILWLKNNIDSKLITAIQDFFIWQFIINTNSNKIQDIGIDNKQLINTIISEYQLVRHFFIPIDKLKYSFNPKSNLFAILIGEYHKFLTRKSCINLFDLADMLINNTINYNTNGEVYHYGFNQLTVQQKAVFDKLSATKLSINIKANKPNITTKTFTDDNDEVTEATNWAYKKYQNNNKQKIAVIVPNLASIKSTIISKLDNAFNYHKNLLTSDKKAYNISLGESLLSYGLVSNAMDILEFSRQWQTGFITRKLCARVVCSSYISSYDTELNIRANIANKLLNSGDYQISTNSILSISKNNSQLNKTLLNLTKLMANITAIKQSHSWYLDKFITILLYWGFCDNKHLSSYEFQVFNKWQKAQLEFNTLDIIGKNLTFNQALKNLGQLLSNITFQPKVDTACIHILGQLEAQNLFFDNVWILGVSDDFLPGMLKRLSFIDYHLAVLYKLPNSDYNQLQIRAKITLNNLISTSSNICISYAQTKDNNSQLPSPMIDFDNNITEVQSINNTLVSLVVIDDYQAQKVNNKHIKKGIKTLSSQAQCPFKGFSTRLNIDDSVEPYIGFNAMDRGRLIHRALELIWQDIQTLDALKKCHNLAQTINKHLDTILANSELEKIEKTRLFAIIYNFLQLELQRDDFKIINLEYKQKVNIAGLVFNVRFDRIDKDINNNTIIFDYKSGSASLAKLGIAKDGLLKNAVSEPQLAIYALNYNANAVMFVVLKADMIKYLGFADSDSMSYLIKKSNVEYYTKLKQYWQKQLAKTSNEFQNGNAQILPIKGACDYCNLAGLCRINASALSS